MEDRPTTHRLPIGRNRVMWRYYHALKLLGFTRFYDDKEHFKIVIKYINFNFDAAKYD
jgi:hypothetical protein